MRVNITWIDTVSYHGWYNKCDIEDIISGYKIITNAIFVRKTKLFIVVAKHHNKQSDEFGDIAFIPKGSIIKMKKIGG